MPILEYYISKEKRDARYKELKQLCYSNIRRGTTGPQYLHPMYVTDFEGPEKHDTGFGNTVYKTYFKNLYKVKTSN